MDTIAFTVPGPPTPKARARVCRAGAYTPRRTNEYEATVRSLALLARQKAKQRMWTGPVSIYAEFRLRGNGTSKPDLDNLIKSVKDACSGIIYADDAQIVEIEACKVGGCGIPCATFVFQELGEQRR